MTRKSCLLSEVYDTLALRVLVDDEDGKKQEEAVEVSFLSRHGPLVGQGTHALRLLLLPADTAGMKDRVMLDVSSYSYVLCC